MEIDGEFQSKYYRDVLEGKENKELDIGNAGNDVGFYKKDLSKHEAKRISKERYDIEKGFYIPTEDEINYYSTNHLSLSSLSDNSLREYVREYGHFAYAGRGEYGGISYYRIVSALHKEGDWEATYEIAENELYRIRWADKAEREMILARIAALLKKEAKTIPLMSLNGYSVKNCPKEIMKHAKKIKMNRTY